MQKLVENSLQALFDSTCDTYNFYTNKARDLEERIELLSNEKGTNFTQLGNYIVLMAHTKAISSFLKEKLFNLISFAKDCKVKLSFPKDDELVTWIFACYYSDPIHFESYRNVIDIEHCKLSDDFIHAYTANSNDMDAYRWFSQVARSRKY